MKPQVKSVLIFIEIESGGVPYGLKGGAAIVRKKRRRCPTRVATKISENGCVSSSVA